MSDTTLDEMNIMKQAFASAKSESFKHRPVKPRAERPKRVKPAPVRRVPDVTKPKMAGRGFTTARVISDALPLTNTGSDELRELALLLLEDTDTFHIEGRCVMTPVMVRAELVSHKVMTTAKIQDAVMKFVNKYLNEHKFAFKHYFQHTLRDGAEPVSVANGVSVTVTHILKNRYRFTVTSGDTIRYVDLHM